MNTQKTMLVSFSGTRGAGKDTAADMMAGLFEREDFEVKRFSFAGEVYKEISDAFSVSVESLQDRSTKETPVPWLTLSSCRNPHFAPVAIDHISKWRSLDGLEPITENSPLSARELLKCWGTQFRRDSEHGHQRYWIDKVEDLFDAHHEVDCWVCSDCRLDNERDMLKSRDAVMIRINASHLPEDDEEICRTGHESDTQWRKWNYDHVLTNEWGCPEIVGEHLAEIQRDLTEKFELRSDHSI